MKHNSKKLDMAYYAVPRTKTFVPIQAQTAATPAGRGDPIRFDSTSTIAESSFAVECITPTHLEAIMHASDLLPMNIFSAYIKRILAILCMDWSI